MCKFSSFFSILFFILNLNLNPKAQEFPSNFSNLNDLNDHNTQKKLDTLRLSLDQVITKMLKENPKVLQAKAEWKMKTNTAQAAYGEFEPKLVAKYNQMDSERNKGRYIDKTREYNIGIAGKLLPSTEYSFEFKLNDFKHPQTITQDPSAYSLVSLKQALLKGAWYDKSLTNLRISKIDEKIALQAYRFQIMDILQEVEKNYWTSTYYREKFNYAFESAKFAEHLVSESQQFFTHGKISEMDFWEAKAGLSQRIGALMESRQELFEVSTNLMMSISPDDSVGSIFIIANDSLMNEELKYKSSFIDADSSNSFIRFQPSYLSRLSELEKGKNLLNYYKWNTLPELNATFTYGYSGTSKKFENALYQVQEREQSLFGVGLEFKMPLLFGIQEHNELKNAKIQIRVAERMLTNAKYELHNQQNLFQQKINDIKQRSKSLGEIVAFYKKLLEIELYKLKVGKSSINKVYEVEEKLFESQMKDLENRVQYRVAMLKYSYTFGYLLLDRGLEINNEKETKLDASLSN